MPGPFSLRGEAGCEPEAGFLAEGFREAALSATLRPSHLRCCRQWQNRTWLPHYSGGTAPDSHRLPFYPPMGTFGKNRHLVSEDK